MCKKLKQASPLEIWQQKLSSLNSNSKTTFKSYLVCFKEFCTFIESTPEELVQQWHQARSTGNMLDRDNYIENIMSLADQYLTALVSAKKYSSGSIANRFSAVQSFFKYMRIPVQIQIPKRFTAYHNRDITDEEVNLIIDAAPSFRDRVYYTMMAQSGLRPVTLCQLKYKYVKEDLEANRIPCLIRIPKELAKGKYRDYFTFVGAESVEALKQYLKTRPPMSDEDYLFTVQRANKRTTEPHLTEIAISAKFNLLVRKLKLLPNEQYEKGQERYDKPKELRLYSLRKWFRNTVRAPEKFTQFWMGHTLSNDDEHYFTQDAEKHREEYTKVQDNLRIHPIQPQNVEVETLTKQLEEERGKREELETSIQKLTKDLELFKKEFVESSEKYEYVRVPKKKQRSQAKRAVNHG